LSEIISKCRLRWLRSLFFVLALIQFFFSFSGFECFGKQKKKNKKSRKPHVFQKYALKTKVVDLENPDSPEFASFLEKIKALKEEKEKQANILIIGDSHMQCEDFGNALRDYFIDSLKIPFAGRGFAFPYSLAKTSQRSEMYFGPSTGWHGCRFTKPGNECEWGMAGWTAHFDKDSTTFSWRMGNIEFKKGDEILLFSPLQKAYTYRINMFDSSFQNQGLFYNPSRYAFEGKVLNNTKKLFFNLKKNSEGAEFVLQGLLVKPQKNGFVCGISGTNGARLDHYLQSPDFQKHMVQINPNLVVLCLGTNDVYANDFDEEGSRAFLQLLLSKIKAGAPNSAILMVGPPDHCINRKRINPKTEKINEIFSQTAQQLDFVFWNQQKAMGGKGSIFAWRNKRLATKDMVHFEPGGYKKQANLLGQAIKTQFLKLN